MLESRGSGASTESVSQPSRSWACHTLHAMAHTFARRVSSQAGQFIAGLARHTHMKGVMRARPGPVMQPHHCHDTPWLWTPAGSLQAMAGAPHKRGCTTAISRGGCQPRSRARMLLVLDCSIALLLCGSSMHACLQRCAAASLAPRIGTGRPWRWSTRETATER
jgi:hypothetical protein